MTVLVDRVYATAANDTIANISIGRFDNITDQWGGWSSNQTAPPDWGRMIWEIVSVYPDFVGPVGWFILFFLPFVMMWIAHADMVPAAIVGMFFGLYVFAYVGSQYSYIGIVFMAIAVASMVWSMWLKRG
jgi:hypothetical protein